MPCVLFFFCVNVALATESVRYVCHTVEPTWLSSPSTSLCSPMCYLAVCSVVRTPEVFKIKYKTGLIFSGGVSILIKIEDSAFRI